MVPDPGAGGVARADVRVRAVWNRALSERTDVWRQRQTRTRYEDTSAWLTQWKRNVDTEWLDAVSSVPLQQTLRHQQTAFRRPPGWRLQPVERA